MRKIVGVALILFLLTVCLLAQDEPDKESSKEDAEKALLSQVDSFKKDVSRIRGKEFLDDFKVGVKSKDELRKYILGKTEDPAFTKEIKQSTKLLVKLGLITPEFDLKKVMVEFLTEQVAGFYDPEKKELYLMEGTLASPMGSIAVAHEIFHALQDQYFHIDSIIKAIHRNEDRAIAAFAVIEGEATLGGFEYMMDKNGQSIIKLPMDFGDLVRQQTQAIPAGSALSKTPRFIRETLFFRYVAGSTFVQQALRKYQSWKDLDRLFNNLPLSTEQLMHPEKYFDEIDYPVCILPPQLEKQLQGKWEEIYATSMGEFQISLLLAEFIDEKTASAAAAGWDGDFLIMVESKEKGGPQVIAWLSVWDTKKDAEEFVKAYAATLGKRYKKEPELIDNGYFLSLNQGEETVLVEFAGKQVLVVQGAPYSLIPEFRSIILKARQVTMDEESFDDLSKQKLELPELPEKEESQPKEKEPASKDF
jgi:hypothetical protein